MAEPKNQMLKLAERLFCSERLTKNTLFPFLNENSLHAFTLTCQHYRKQYKEEHAKKLADKKAAAEMLHCVLNPTLPNQTRFLELLSIPKQDKNGQPLYLIPNHGEEVYFNKARTRKTKTKRYSTNVLEAILRTKNFHLARALFNCIPEQEKTENLKRYISVIKSQEIWGMPELQLAYDNFIGPWDALFDDKKVDELRKLSGCIGRAQKEHLPWFSIYLFCHPVAHSNTDYTKAPNWTCITWEDSELDLDLFGVDSIYALYKGRGRECGDSLGRMASAWGCGVMAADDSQAFSSQCKVLSSEMDKTIVQYGLDNPELDAAKKLGSP